MNSNSGKNCTKNTYYLHILNTHYLYIGNFVECFCFTTTSRQSKRTIPSNLWSSELEVNNLPNMRTKTSSKCSHILKFCSISLHLMTENFGFALSFILIAQPIHIQTVKLEYHLHPFTYQIHTHPTKMKLNVWQRMKQTYFLQVFFTLRKIFPLSWISLLISTIITP